MHIGICKITLRIPQNQTLKGKRRIVKSLCDKLKSHFNVTVAEVEHQDLWQLAGIGIVCVSGDSLYLQQTLSKIISFIESSAGEFELSDVQQKITIV